MSKAFQSSAILVGILLGFLPAQAASITAQSTSSVDVSAAILASSNGDTITIPAGTSTWNSPVIVTKGVTILGAGTNNTRLINGTSGGQGLESPLFDIRLSSDQPIRVSGIYFQDNGLDRNSDGVDIDTVSVLPTKIRIDHCTFEGFSFGVKHYGAFGVVHDCLFLNNKVAARNAGYVNSSALGGVAAPAWPWGSANYFVFEDCVFQLSNWSIDTYMMDTEYPCNYMVRYCTFNINRSSAVVADGFDMHGNAGSSLNAVGIVIYKNTFNYTGNNTVNPCRLVDIRGGVGSLVYSNTATGVNLHATMRDDPVSSPLMSNTYVWNNTGNGSAMSISTGDGVTQGTQYFTSQPAGFAQLQYPHPLRGQSSQIKPTAPTSLRVLAGI